MNSSFINYKPYLFRQIFAMVRRLSYKYKQLQIIFKNIMKLFKGNCIYLLQNI